jgi:hypothetical protein
LPMPFFVQFSYLIDDDVRYFVVNTFDNDQETKINEFCHRTF